MTRTARELPSFGALLKSLRTRSRLTQLQLAEAIGVHRHAIGRWEQGDCLPASKALVLELAKPLHLDDQETRHLLEASLTALSPLWSVPLPRNLFFTGREEILEALHTQLGVNRAVALTPFSALHGLGGIGKTQVALEYAYRYALEYSAVFWIGAETIESIVSSLLQIAEELQLLERDDKDLQRAVAAVHHWLTTHRQWLLIWDNVEDPALLHRFLPSARQGAMLLTTRCQVLGTLARGIDLLPMEQEEGILFLFRRAKMLEPAAESRQVRQLAERMPARYAAAAELVTVMGALPLALDQAGAYLEATCCGLPAYLELFRTRRAALLQQRGAVVHDHPASIFTTFTLALTATAQRHPAVRDLLCVCALLQSDAIPEALFRQSGEQLGATLAAVCGDALAWDQVITVACTYSLLFRQPEEQMLSMHRLVQAVLLDSMTEAEREQWNKRVIGALDGMFPAAPTMTEYATWKQGEHLLPHVLLCLQRAEAAEESLAIASLAYKAAQYLRVRGQYAEAEPLYLRALHIREQVLGPDHPEVARSLNYLAALYWRQGKYGEGEPLLLRALHIWEQVLGPDHPEVARSLNNLALLYREQGKYAEMEPLYLRALRIKEQALGPDHTTLASSLNNLALLYKDQSRYAEAEPLYLRALRLWEQALGPDHPEVANLLNNLASLYLDQGRYAEAEPLYRRALHLWEQALGPDHPDVAESLNGLAELYRKQGKYAEAEALYLRALHLWEQTLKPDHPEVAYPLYGLAILSQVQGKYGEAEAFFQRALAIREQQLGQQHPETAQTLHRLAIFHQKQSHLSEALSLAERALLIRSSILGDTHVKTIATRTLYAQLVQEHGRAEETASTEPCEEETADPGREAHTAQRAAGTLLETPTPSALERDLFQEFLTACCELHPLVWCRISDLWHTYTQWTVTYQERVPLSRRAFAAQVKAQGCRADRTSTARIWRGITLLKKHP